MYETQSLNATLSLSKIYNNDNNNNNNNNNNYNYNNYNNNNNNNNKIFIQRWSYTFAIFIILSKLIKNNSRTLWIS